MPSPATHSRTLITGAASGIGRALALRLHRAGHQLVLLDANGEALAAVANDLGGVDTEPNVQTAVVDVTDAAAVVEALAAATSDGRELTAVVHSAGILRTGLFSEQSPADHQALARVNLGGSFAVAYAALPHLRRSHGMLVLMGSAAAFWGPPEYAAYGATKAAVFNLAQALRIELADDGVAVGTCNPLFVSTPMVTDSSHEPQLLKAQGVAHSADEVAAAIERGLGRRSAQIWVGRGPQGPRGIFLMSRLFFPFGHRLLLRAWRKAKRASSSAASSPANSGVTP